MTSSSHRAMFAGLLAICFALFIPSQARARITPDAEHTVWVAIETTPSGATLYAPPAEDGTLGPRIGTTPCILAVDLKWGYRWFVKQWDDIRISSPGDICYAAIQPDLRYDLFLNFTLIKDGYREQAIDTQILTLKHPGKKWAGSVAWPTRARFFTELDREVTRGDIPATTALPPMRRVILADSQTDGVIGAAGTLTVHANVDSAEVVIGGKVVGTTPMQVVLKEGEHLLEVRKPGYHSLRRRIVVEDDAELAYRAVLQPLDP